METSHHFNFPRLVMLILVSFHILPVLSNFTSFLFGDSLVDVGNNDYLFTLSKANSPPYGIDFKPSGGLPTGRFTNGRTISDIVGQALGAQLFPPPYLSPNTEPFDAITAGINYASGSSGILDETGFLFIGRIPLREQVNNFQQTRTYLVKMLGDTGTEELLKKAILSVTIGSNDVLSYVQPTIPLLGQEKVSPTTFQDLLISNLTVQLKRLYELGGRKFVVAGVGPLGCIPFVRALNLLPTGKCSAEVNEIIQGYNAKLKAVLNRLNQEMGPEVIFIYANSYDIFMGMIINYHQYGFDDVSEPCCGGYFPPFVCFLGGNTNATSVLCNDRSKYVFWDAYHPTEAANVIIANELLDGDETKSFPINIRQLYNYDPF